MSNRIDSRPFSSLEVPRTEKELAQLQQILSLRIQHLHSAVVRILQPSRGGDGR